MPGRPAAAREGRAEATAIFTAAVAAVDPAALVERCLRRAWPPRTRRGGPEPRTLVIGAGKAAARMAAGCERVLGPEHAYGLVIVADGCGVPLEAVEVVEAGHPLPDDRGAQATQRLVRMLRGSRAASIVCVISGGASSLLVLPRAPVTLADKIVTTRLLLDCGADIVECNTVRAHLSEVKGGGLLRYTSTPILGLLLSDVIGDDPSTIGSGPTVADARTFVDAAAILERYGLLPQLPASVTATLERGVRGEIVETVKPGTPEAGRCRNLIVGSNRMALAGAAAAAAARGWLPHVEDAPLLGDTTEAARCFAARVRSLSRGRSARPLCVIAGGETTVRVRGHGRGGRNQEFALALAEEIAGENVTILSAGTDGVDGPTDAAGAFVDGSTSHRARTLGLDITDALGENDAHTFFAQLGDLFRCGPTGTNVMDIKIALVRPRTGEKASRRQEPT